MKFIDFEGLKQVIEYFKGIIVDLETTSHANSTYLSKTSAASTYATQAEMNQTKADMDSYALKSESIPVAKHKETSGWINIKHDNENFYIALKDKDGAYYYCSSSGLHYRDKDGVWHHIKYDMPSIVCMSQKEYDALSIFNTHTIYLTY